MKTQTIDLTQIFSIIDFLKFIFDRVKIKNNSIILIERNSYKYLVLYYIKGNVETFMKFFLILGHFFSYIIYFCLILRFINVY